jgi:hypothetical protein
MGHQCRRISHKSHTLKKSLLRRKLGFKRKQNRQLCDIDRDPPRLVFADEQLRAGAPRTTVTAGLVRVLDESL